MEKPGNYLFVYGTLLLSGNKYADYLFANSTFYSKAKFKGVLYDLGSYPGVIADPNYEGWVYGSIFCLNDAEEALKVLDEYEGFGSGYTEPYLFVREFLKIETGDGQLDCWIYLYNLAIDGYRQITSGDYLDYKAGKLT